MGGVVVGSSQQFYSSRSFPTRSSLLPFLSFLLSPPLPLPPSLVPPSLPILSRPIPLALVASHPTPLQVDQLKLSDNALSASFKKSLQDASSVGLDHDTLKVYQQLFKVRLARRRSSSFGSTGSRTNGGTSSNQSSSVNRSRGSRAMRKATAVGNVSPSHASRSGRDSEMRAAMAAAVKDASVVLDPYRKLPTAALAEKAAADRANLLQPLSVELDAPASLKPDPDLWAKLNELRTAKVELELQLKGMTKSMADTLATVQAMERETDGLRNQMNAVIAQIEAARARARRLNWDCDVVLRVTQGQDEVRGVLVPPRASSSSSSSSSSSEDGSGDGMALTVARPSTTNGDTTLATTTAAESAIAALLRKNDYSSAMLVHRSVVEDCNAQVRRRGKDKIDVLTRIKDFRKEINFMAWESEFLALNATNLEAHYKDLHMLRVTKSLQQFLAGSAADRNKQQLSKAEVTLKFNDASMADKAAKLEASVAKADKAIASTRAECEKLEVQKLAVAKRVAQLESVASTANVVAAAAAGGGAGGPDLPASAGGGGADEAARAKMKTVVTRRKLIDLARAQTDEIEFLRKELDRLRQRTFPSFAHSRRAELQRLGNPDEHF
jgi:hypothetical protein